MQKYGNTPRLCDAVKVPKKGGGGSLPGTLYGTYIDNIYNTYICVAIAIVLLAPAK